MNYVRKGKLNVRLAFFGAVALGIGALLLFGGGGGSEGPALLLDAVSAGDWSRGGRNAPAVLVEYADFQCPACASYHPLVKRLSEEMGDRLVVVYRHFPLASIHKNANLAARAAEAAGMQGRFWEMGDKLYANQRSWAESGRAADIFADYAAELGLDADRFREDMDSSAIREKVERDLMSAMRAGLTGTPSFFLNGRKIRNPGSYEEFKTLVEQAAAFPNP